MNTRLVSLPALLLASPLAFAASPPAASPGAATEFPTVSVTVNSRAAPIRRDVRQTCPQIDAALQKSLAPAWGRVQVAGSTRVTFRLEGDRVTEVTSTGLSRDYRSAIRRAVAALECAVPAGTVQTFEFLLSIRAPQDASRQDRLALQIE